MGWAYRFPVCRENMNLVSLDVRMEELPDDFLIPVHFENLNVSGIFLSIAADHRISIGEALSPARILETSVDAFIVAEPSDGPVGREFHGLVPVGQVDHSVAIG